MVFKKTILCNGYCTFQDSKTRKRTCTAGFKNRISGILNPHMGGFKYLILESGIQKPHCVMDIACAMDIAHSGIQKPEEEHALSNSKTAWVGF